MREQEGNLLRMFDTHFISIAASLNLKFSELSVKYNVGILKTVGVVMFFNIVSRAAE